MVPGTTGRGDCTLHTNRKASGPSLQTLAEGLGTELQRPGPKTPRARREADGSAEDFGSWSQPGLREAVLDEDRPLRPGPHHSDPTRALSPPVANAVSRESRALTGPRSCADGKAVVGGGNRREQRGHPVLRATGCGRAWPAEEGHPDPRARPAAGQTSPAKNHRLTLARATVVTALSSMVKGPGGCPWPGARPAYRTRTEPGAKPQLPLVFLRPAGRGQCGPQPDSWSPASSLCACAALPFWVIVGSKRRQVQGAARASSQLVCSAQAARVSARNSYAR